MSLLKLSRDSLNVLRTRKANELPIFFFFFLFLVQNINSSCSDPESRAPGGGKSAGEGGQRRPPQNIS